MQTVALNTGRDIGSALRHLLIYLPVWVGTVASAACLQLLWDDRCGVESRSIIVNARFAEPGEPEAGYVQLDLLERDRDNPERSIWWVLYSESLKGHIIQARLLELHGSSPPTLLFEIPADTGSAGEALRGHPQAYEFPTPFEKLFSLLRSSRVALELETDLLGRELLREILVLHYYRDWSQAHCS